MLEGESAEGTKMKPISPFKFYGEDAPRKLSSDPCQITRPLMEWAQKAHWKHGGLAGHASKLKEQGSLPQRAKLAREYFYEDRIKQLGMLPTREELVAMKSDLLISWQKLPLEDREPYEAMHSDTMKATQQFQSTGILVPEESLIGDLLRFEEDMDEYKAAHPEYEQQNQLKQMERKRLLETRALRKSKKIRKDAKVEYSESEASEPGQETPKRIQEMQTTDGTPKRPSGYTGEYEYPLSPRSVRRFNRDTLKKASSSLEL